MIASARADDDWRPTFLIIGAVKAATTWALEQLQVNPALYLPDPEPHYFSSEYHRGETYYRGFFEEWAGLGFRLGEKSADYLAHAEAPRRVASTLPAARLIVQLRNPVERAYSDYKMLYRRGTVRGKPEDYLMSLDNPQPRFLADGLYARHLERWFDNVPSSQFFIFLFDDIKTDPRGVVSQMSHHIGVEPCFDAQQSRQRANDGSQRFLPLPVRKTLAPFKKTVAPLRGRRWFEATRNMFSRQIDYPAMSHDLQKHLRDFYAADVEQLGRMINRDLAHWLELPALGAERAPAAR